MRELCSVLFLILLFSASVDCDVCVTFDFENGLANNFTNEGICNFITSWIEGTFADLPIESPHTNSNHFIAPTSTLSCINSFVIEMMSHGVFEVNVYMESNNTSDQITVLVQEIVVDNNDIVIGLITLTPTSPDFVDGWHTLRIPTLSSENFSGYVTLMGVQGPDSIVIVDSFRYFTPSTGEDWCQIYKDDIITTLPDIIGPTTEPVVTTETTPKPTTETVYTTEITQESITEYVDITEITTESTSDAIGITETTPETITESVVTTETTFEPTTEPVFTVEVVTEYTTESAATTEITTEYTTRFIVITETTLETTTESIVTIESTPDITTETVGTETTTVTISDSTEGTEPDSTLVYETTTNVTLEPTETIPEATTELVETTSSITESESTTPIPSEIITTTNVPDVQCDDDSFWTPLAITLIVLLILLILIIMVTLFWQIRKRRARRKIPHLLFTDVKGFPPTAV